MDGALMGRRRQAGMYLQYQAGLSDANRSNRYRDGMCHRCPATRWNAVRVPVRRGEVDDGAWMGSKIRMGTVPRSEYLE